MDIILGNGQVGKAVLDNYIFEVEVFDKGEWEDKSGSRSDFLHICIPYGDNFTAIVQQAISVFNPNVVMIHSTVKPGTTADIDHPNKIYSPIMGRHKDDFSKNIQAYTKILAGSDGDCLKAMERFNLGMDRWSGNFEQLEYAKIMSTSYMFWNLLYQKVVMRECEDKGYDFNKVYSEWNYNYNRGISGTHPDWRRPVYHADKNPVPGGHCLVPNTHLVDNLITDILRDWVETKGAVKYGRLD